MYSIGGWKLIRDNTAIDVRDDCFYPPEEKLNKEFIKEAEEADERIKAGMGKAYTPEEFKAKFS